ncbi:aminoglycoside phosphotransferase family protein [Anianabacter salinae]|uniref:aminoglycoside phosphotransferase family protein n=1 Tax=Anianabacter salinae TaxID=2851023 RepID=UPI00225DDDF6|nr:phosphotransferase [Anianabacter salinae]MBV0913494.1 phosphotransferase [Anianabacter salinae]
MRNRAEVMAAFLDRAGWGAATRSLLAGDASNRRYERLRLGDQRAVLMDAPAERGEDVRPFVAIARHLTACGLSAPQILAKDPQAGLLLLEDLGDDVFARVLERAPQDEPMLYRAAVDALLALHAAPLPGGVGAYDVALMTDKAALAYDWYLMGATGSVDTAALAAFRAETETVLAPMMRERQVLILRDYHAENLIWLPHRDGPARVGQLDFQDALIGHPAYDLVSLLKDARRDLAPDTEEAALAGMIARSGADPDSFRAAYAVLGAQRNLRILGVFARLSLHFGKPHYVDLIPRVWSHLVTSLDHPSLAALRDRVLSDLPAPNPAILQTLKAKCATIDHP